MNHEERIRAIESGAHPIRFDWGPGVTTPWFTIDLDPDFDGDCFWRVARSITQLRGTLEWDEPGSWDDGVEAFDLPGDICPAWPLRLVTPHTNGVMCIVHLATNGTCSLYRGPDGSNNIYLDNIHFPRG